MATVDSKPRPTCACVIYFIIQVVFAAVIALLDFGTPKRC